MRDPNYEKRVRESFATQGALISMGAEMVSVKPGEIEIHLPYNERITQQHGYVHGGVIATIADTACGYAALSLMPADANGLSVEFKINFLNPAKGDLFIARAKVTKSGRTLTVCQAEVISGETTIAIMTATIMAVK